MLLLSLSRTEMLPAAETDEGGARTLVEGNGGLIFNVV